MADDKAKPSQKLKQSIEEHGDAEISEETQEMLNKPFSDSKTALSDEDKSFLEDLMKKVDDKEIDLHSPSSIMNQEIYDALSGEYQAKADLFIQSTLFIIRQVYDFYHSDHSNDSDMMISMVRELRQKKETLEKEVGDVLKI